MGDSRYPFVALSSVFCGSTHDPLPFSASACDAKMSAECLPDGHWVAGDAAYSCSESLLVPFSAIQLLHKEEGLWRHAFNFFLSILLVRVEQALRIFVNLFGVLWRPFEYDIRSSSRIVCVCVLLHNFII